MVRSVVKLTDACLVPGVKYSDDAFETCGNDPDLLIVASCDNGHHGVIDLDAV